MHDPFLIDHRRDIGVTGVITVRMPPRGRSSLSSASSFGIDRFVVVQLAHNEWTLHRVVALTPQEATVVEYEPASIIGADSQPQHRTLPYSALSVPAPYSSHTRTPVFALSSLNPPLNTDWTTVYYAATIQPNKNKKASKDKTVLFSDGTLAVLPTEAVFDGQTMMPSIVQLMQVTPEMVNAALNTPTSTINDVVSPVLTGQKRARDDVDDGQQFTKRSAINVSVSIPLEDSIPMPASLTLSPLASSVTAPSQYKKDRKPRRWYLSLPSFRSQLESKLSTVVVTRALTNDERDGDQHRGDSALSGYIDSSECWHEWDQVKSLPSKNLIVAPYCPIITH